MSGLLFLTYEDFFIGKGTDGPILCNQIKGLSLILFYSTQCTYCQKFIPIFKRMPGSINGCQFGMINVSQNKQCVLMSKETIAPITYVPYIILYVNGKPYMVYNGPYDENEIKRFVIEVANSIMKRQKMDSEDKVKRVGKSIPEFTIGIPLCGEDERCYLEFDDAYHK
jgi:hypothetical protein